MIFMKKERKGDWEMLNSREKSLKRGPASRETQCRGNGKPSERGRKQITEAFSPL